MTQQPLPNQPYAGPPKKPRPRAVWFVVGGVLLVLAPVVFAGALFLTLRPLAQEDAKFPADGQPHEVTLPAGEERAVFASNGAALGCEAADGNGPVEMRGTGGSYTFNEWRAVNRFDTGDGQLVFTCTSPTPTEARIASLPSTEGFVGGLLVGILAPIVLGLLGLVILIVTGVLWATRPPRRQPGT